MHRFNLEFDMAVSAEIKGIHKSSISEISRSREVKAKSNLSLMLKEEVLALPSPKTLNDMISRVQSKLKFRAFELFNLTG